jgi:hypothetical protein
MADKKPAKGSLDDLLEGSLNQKPAAAPKAERLEKDAERSQVRSEGASRRDYAPPPSGWQGGPAAAPSPQRAAPVARKTAHKSVSDNPLEGLDGFGGNVPSGAAEADEQVEHGKASAKKKTVSSYDAEESVTGAAAPRSVPTSSNKPSQPSAKAAQAPAADDEKQLSGLGSGKNELKSKQDSSSEQVLARHADQLYAARRWSEAVAAYRELLRRYPDADAGARWRARLKEAMAQADVQQAPAQTTSKQAKSQQQKDKALLEAAPAKE